MRILISGAGVAGPCLAWHLAKAGGHQITVIEKSRSLLSQGQNIDVTDSALKVVRKMGLLDELRRRNTGEKGTAFVLSSGKPFASFPLIPGLRNSMTNEFEILRGDLATLMYEATKDLENVDYQFGSSIARVLENGEKSVKVELANGEQQEHDLLVAADGQWSRIRKQCFPAESVTAIDKKAFAIYWTLPRIANDNDMWQVYTALKSRVLWLRPDPYGTIRAGFTYMPSSEQEKKEWKEACRSDYQTKEALLRKTFGDAGWQVNRMLDSLEEQPGDFYMHAIEQIKLAQWSNNRVVCLGDAAYAPTPLTGKGAPLAILGSYVLAGEISKLQEGQHPSAALEAYEAAFKPFTKEIQQIPSFIPGIVHPAAEWHRILIRGLIWTLSQVAKQHWLIKRVGGTDEGEDFKLPYYAAFEQATAII